MGRTKPQFAASLYNMNESQHIRDQLLVLRAQADGKAFDALVGRWHPVLWRHAYRMTHNPEAAWDVMQEAWCAIFRGLHRLENPEAFPKWAFQVVTNKCRDQARSTGRRNRAMQAYERRAEKQATPNTRDEQVELAVMRLDSELRLVVSLYYKDAFGVREIAEITGWPEGSVKSRLYRARNELRRLLEEMNHE